MSTKAFLRSVETVALTLNCGNLSPTLSMVHSLGLKTTSFETKGGNATARRLRAASSFIQSIDNITTIDSGYDTAMNLRDLRYLVALAEHKHFGRAADASFVSQPTLSTQIKKLEDELDVALVERTPRKILLTEVGREIATRARHVLDEVEQ